MEDFTAGMGRKHDMNDMLTAKDIQVLLQVDRSTVYRMAENQRIPAVKVGRQWRFPKDRVESWLQSQSIGSGVISAQPVARHLSQTLPVACVQMIQDVFSNVLGVFMVVTDMQGKPATEPSGTPGLLRLALGSSEGTAHLAQGWAGMGVGAYLEPRYETGPLGLLYTRGLIRAGTDLTGMVIVGGIAPENWPPVAAEIERLACVLGVVPESVAQRVSEVYRRNAIDLRKVLAFVQPIADVVAHMVDERMNMVARLEAIAQLTRNQL